MMLEDESQNNGSMGSIYSSNDLWRSWRHPKTEEFLDTKKNLIIKCYPRKKKAMTNIGKLPY